MRTSTALMRVARHASPGVASLRQRLRERALGEASLSSLSPRVWMEALERRVMMSGTVATVALDRSFGDAGYASAALPWKAGDGGVEVAALASGPNGTIYAAANVQPPGDYPYFNTVALVRFSADGRTDKTFGNNGVVTIRAGDDFSSDPDGSETVVGSLLVQPDGKVLLVAEINMSLAGFFRFNMDGSPDTSFGSDGRVLIDSNNFQMFDLPLAWLEADGKILAFLDQDTDFSVVRLTADGTLDRTFADAGRFTLNPLGRHTLWYYSGDGQYYQNLAAAGPLPGGGMVGYFESSHL